VAITISPETTNRQNPRTSADFSESDMRLQRPGNVFNLVHLMPFRKLSLKGALKHDAGSSEVLARAYSSGKGPDGSIFSTKSYKLGRDIYDFVLVLLHLCHCMAVTI
jgi:hypothetical protein